jgi:type VI secretion system secreted protein Hcp
MFHNTNKSIFIKIESIHSGVVLSEKANSSCSLGEKNIESHLNECSVFGYNHNIIIPTDPKDKFPSGHVVHNPLTIIKPIDSASPLLFKAICFRERLECEISFFRMTDGSEECYYKIILNDAFVSNIDMDIQPFKQNFSEFVERVSFGYRKITMKHIISDTSAENCWLLRR